MKRLMFIFLGVWITFQANAQTDNATTKRMVVAKHFSFIASSAMPMNGAEINSVLSKMSGNTGGAIINLTGNHYGFTLSPDSITVDLPYYGRAYRAPVNSEDNGYKFTSTKFSYESKVRKKGGWEININPQDTREGVQMSLTITSNGYITLILNSNNKQTITYNGYLTEPGKSL